MIVLTIDQYDSRHRKDLIPQLLQACKSSQGEPLLERTAGDEAQGVFQDAAHALEIILWALRDGQWHIGVGGGQGHIPDDGSPRGGSGPAFIDARIAVEASKTGSISLAVRSEKNSEQAAQLEGLLRLYGVLAERRSSRQWEVIDAFDTAGTGKEAAKILGITAQGISRSLRASAWREESNTYSLAIRLLEEISQ